uniref:RRM domain-containing protein n=1 Tax=Araucaria cunninghamii TaxID=56994 RepID=A0A0D6R6C1_ARACU
MEMEGKKRRFEDSEESKEGQISEEDAVKLIEPLLRDQLVEIVKYAAVKHFDVLEEIRKIADKDPSRRKLFVRGLGLETTLEAVKSVFAQHGEIEEANLIVDRNTGKNKGYGFITYAHVEGAISALKEPSKKIDGRMTVSNLASVGPPQQLQQQLQQQQLQFQQIQFQQLQQQPTPPVVPIQPIMPVMPIPAMHAQQPIPIQPVQTVQSAPLADVSQRRIYIGNVPTDMEPGRLLNFFSQYGDIEEGPVGYDKKTGKFKGYALIVYKTVEATKKAVDDPVKSIDGHQLFCKMAVDGQKQKVATNSGQNLPDSNAIANMKPSSLDPSAVQYSGLANPALGVHQFAAAAAANSSALAGTGLSSYGLNDAALSNLSRDTPFHSSLQSSLGRDHLQGLSPLPGSARTSLGTDVYGVTSYGSSGYNGIGGAASLYGIPSTSSITQSASNAPYEGANQYGNAIALASYQSQHQGASPSLRVPLGGTLPGMRSYYPS